MITVSSDAVAAHPAVASTGDPTGISAAPEGTHVYVANEASASVSVIATSTNTVSSTLAEATVGKAPYGVLATPSPYYYKLQGTHGAWASALDRRCGLPLGWNVGGWQ